MSSSARSPATLGTYATCVAVCSSLMTERAEREAVGADPATKGSSLTGNYEWRTPQRRFTGRAGQFYSARVA